MTERGICFEPKNGRLHGWFEQVIWEGIQSETDSEDDFGVRTIALVS